MNLLSAIRSVNIARVFLLLWRQSIFWRKSTEYKDFLTENTQKKTMNFSKCASYHIRWWTKRTREWRHWIHRFCMIWLKMKKCHFFWKHLRLGKSILLRQKLMPFEALSFMFQQYVFPYLTVRFWAGGLESPRRPRVANVQFGSKPDRLALLLRAFKRLLC